jgi:hypothetical protein
LNLFFLEVKPADRGLNRAAARVNCDKGAFGKLRNSHVSFVVLRCEYRAMQFDVGGALTAKTWIARALNLL